MLQKQNAVYFGCLNWVFTGEVSVALLCNANVGNTTVSVLTGIHGEGVTFTSLLALFFWDIIYMDGIPDVFYGPFQAQPLDLRWDEFYLNRKEDTDARLQQISCSSEQVPNYQKSF